MCSRLIVESIATEEALLAGAAAEDIAFVEQFTNLGRRCEVLAWRAIVRRKLGENVRIFYDDYGAPKVANPNRYISVSHSREYVAVLLSDAPCAVDIESVERDFRKVASRYLSVEEQTMAERYGIFAELWSAKEALYKYYKKGKLDLVRDISITNYNPENTTLTATILGSHPITVNLDRRDNLVIATIG